MTAKTKRRSYVEIEDRRAGGIKCECGGYAESVDTTEAEERLVGCGRPGCCARAFLCVLCGMRRYGKAPAPEMDFS